jgi:hypothetical protein
MRPEWSSAVLARPVGPGRRELPAGDAYWICEHRTAGGVLSINPRADLRVLMVVSGSALIGGLDASPGTTVILPAAIVPTTAMEAEAGSVVLEIGLA